MGRKCNFFYDLPVHLVCFSAECYAIVTSKMISNHFTGVSVRHHWQKLNRDVFKRDNWAQQCAFHDPSFAQEDWRQIFLDNTCQQKLQAIEHCKPEELQQQHGEYEGDWSIMA